MRHCDYSFGSTNAVNLEHVLGDIQTDRGNLHVDGSPSVIRLTTITLWHFDAGSGRRPPHQTRKLPGCVIARRARREAFALPQSRETPASARGLRAPGRAPRRRLQDVRPTRKALPAPARHAARSFALSAPSR